MEDERLSFDIEDLDRDALIDEAVQAVQEGASLEGVMRSTRSRSFNTPEADVLGVLQALKTEKAAFGPRPEVLPLDSEALKSQGVALDGRVKGLLERFDFYDVTFPVTLFPKRGWAFDRLECQVEFNPGEKPERRPLAHDIFPGSDWQTLAKATMHLEIGITEILEFRAKAAVPSLASAGAEGKFAAGASFFFPPRDYHVKRARLVSSGKNASEVLWRLDDESFFEEDEPRLGVILKVPKGVKPVKAKGVLAAYRSFRTLSLDLGDLMDYLSERVRNFFRKGAPLVDRGEWHLF
ncbi:MAG TPA: hypothetical protein VLX28_17020 [Thermoanaerobaculia bacterium]|nr:hypothetical protein [Thermoanaerobaculia bacterium]